jgi:surface antigen
VIASALALGACSAIPLPSFVSQDDVTGSIGAPVSPLSSALDAEDWRRAKSALGVALDPQGNGAPAGWDNPVSGAKGTFTPVGDAYPSDDLICRAFLAQIGGKIPAHQVQGIGCRDKSGDWAVNDVKPSKPA